MNVGKVFLQNGNLKGYQGNLSKQGVGKERREGGVEVGKKKKNSLRMTEVGY